MKSFNLVQKRIEVVYGDNVDDIDIFPMNCSKLKVRSFYNLYFSTFSVT